MADVPQYSPSGTVAPAPLPGPRFSGSSPEDFGYSAAKSQEQVAGQIEAAAREQVMLQNQVRVNDAMNQVRQKALDLTYDKDDGYSNLTGRNALDRPSGKPLTDEYSEKLNETISAVSAGLTPQQQRVFQQQAAGVATSFRGDVMHHTASQARAYALDVAKGAIDLGSQGAVQAYQTGGGIDGLVPQVDTLVGNARSAVYASSKVTGMSGDSTTALMNAAESEIHRTVIKAALENQDPLFAKNYYERYKSKLTANDALQVMGQVNQSGLAAISQQADGMARTSVLDPAMNPSESDRLARVLGVTDDPTLTDQPGGDGMSTSPAGHAMVDPGVQGSRDQEALRIIREERSKATDPGDIKALDAEIARMEKGASPAGSPATRSAAGPTPVGGRANLSALMARYDNNPVAVAAALRAGTDAVDRAMKEAKSVGEPEIWLQSEHIPPEARKFAVEKMQQFVAGGGAAQVPTEQEYIDTAVKNLGPGAAPQVIDLTRQRAAATYAVFTKSRAQRVDQVLDEAMREITAAGGDYAAVQTRRPDLFAKVAAMAPGREDDLKRYARTLAKPEGQDNMALYADMVQHPEQLAGISDQEFALQVLPGFKPETQKELVKLRADTLNGKKDNGVGAINDSALNKVLDERLEQIHLDPKAKDLTTRTRYGTVQKFLREDIFAQQQALGRKMTPEEIEARVDLNFSNQQVTNHWWRSDTTQPELAMTYGDVPAITRGQIDSAMPNASEDDKLRAYWAARAAARAKQQKKGP